MMRVPRRTVVASECSLAEFCDLFVSPPIRSQRELAERAGLAQPRVSELWRGRRIYPAGMAKVCEALGVDEALFEALLENSARLDRERAAAPKGGRR